jgi:hypothetical protein
MSTELVYCDPDEQVLPVVERLIATGAQAALVREEERLMGWLAPGPASQPAQRTLQTRPQPIS